MPMCTRTTRNVVEIRPHGTGLGGSTTRIVAVIGGITASCVLLAGCGGGTSLAPSTLTTAAAGTIGAPAGTLAGNSPSASAAAGEAKSVANGKGNEADTQAGVFRGDFEEEVLLTGELKAVRARTIVAPETSIFQMRIQYLPDEGSEVKQGDPLVDFDNTALADRVQDLETRILDAETQIVAKRSELATALMDLQIENAQKRYDADRTAARAGVDPDVLSRKDYGERQFDARKTAMELAEVKQRIESTEAKGKSELDVLIIDKEKLERDLVSTRKDLEILSVKAPQDGLVVYEYREGTQAKWREGDNVWPGQPVASLPDLSAMEVQFAVSEVDAPRLRVGMPVAITIDSLPERRLSGSIVEIPSMAVTRDPESSVRIFRIRSTLSETIRGTMKPGMSVLGRVIVDRRPGSLLVARDSVLYDGTRYTMLADGGSGSERREIRPIGRSARHYLIEADTKAPQSGGASR